MPTNNITLEEIAQFLKSKESFVIICHKRPDGDTLGSALGLKRALVHLGKKAEIICAHIPSSNNEFLFDGEYFPAFEAEDDNAVFITVDVASKELLGELEAIYGDRITLKIDHHETSDDFAERNYTDYSAAACGEIIYELLDLLGVPLSVSAEPIYAAVSSDTGGFRYSNTTARTHRIAANLLEAGADNAFIDHMLFESRTQSEILALTAAYASMRYYLDGKVAVVMITNDDKRRLDLREEDLGVISPITREISGVQVGITIKQNKSDASKYKISVRSEPGFPANALCELFGGGGHPCAAGAEISASNPKIAVATIIKHLAIGENGVEIV